LVEDSADCIGIGLGDEEHPKSMVSPHGGTRAIQATARLKRGENHLRTPDQPLPRSRGQNALGFLMTRDITHRKFFKKALYAMEGNFPPGKLPGQRAFTNKYYNMSQGEGDMRGPWNQGEQWRVVEDRTQQVSADGVDASASVKLSRKDQAGKRGCPSHDVRLEQRSDDRSRTRRRR
jgi:hypothetical protein